MTGVALLAAVVTAPLEPGPDEARDLLLDELAKLEYAQAQPTWFDLLTQAIVEWIAQTIRSPSAVSPRDRAARAARA